MRANLMQQVVPGNGVQKKMTAQHDMPDGLAETASSGAGSPESAAYRLDEQVGYLLRLANQRHLEIFNAAMPDLTPTQFSLMARLLETGDASQNELGRSVGIDAATTNGVIDRLVRKGLLRSCTDDNDKRRLRISLTATGRTTITRALPIARVITAKTLRSLTVSETRQLTRLLHKLQQEPTTQG